MGNDFVMVPRTDLVRLQENMDPHRGAVAWGIVCDLLARPAEQHQGEPVVLPARMYYDALPTWHEDNKLVDGWNACLDEIAKLGPLYTHADPGEVGRYKGELQKLRVDSSALAGTVEGLRTKLAERDALLREASGYLDGHPDNAICARSKLHQKFRDIAAASAEPNASAAKCTNEDPWNCKYCRNTESCEALKDPRNFGYPSAPVEIDERAAFEANWALRKRAEGCRERANAFYRVQPNDRYRWNEVQDGWDAWQARAALERKS